MFTKRFGRIKKRTFAVLAICLLAIVLPVFFLFVTTTKQVKSSNIAHFSLNERASRQSVQGLGYNLISYHDQNLLKNNSFEPLVYKQNFNVDSGDEETLKIVMPDDLEPGSYEDDFFIGAKAEVLTNDPEGNPVLKKTGIVEEFLSDQIDDFQSLQLPPDLPHEIRWSTVAELEQKVVLGGSKGYLLYIDAFTETHLLKLPTTNDIVGICVFENNFLALDQKGVFYKSTDALNWQHVFSADQKFLLNKGTEQNSAIQNESSEQDTINWHDLSSYIDEQGKTIFMAVGEEGYLIYGDLENYYVGRINSKQNINSVTANANGFYLVGDNSSAFYSADGEVFQILDIPLQANWQTVASRGNQILLGGDQGEVVFSNDGSQFENISSDSITEISLQFSEQNDQSSLEQIVFNPRFVSCSILGNEQIVILDSRGLLYFSQDLGKNWRSLNERQGNRYNLIRRLPSGRLVGTGFDSGVEYAAMGLAIKLDSKLEQGKYENGDLLRLEQLATKPIIKPLLEKDEILAGEWFVSDPQVAAVQFRENSPEGGKSSLRIDLTESTNPIDQLYGIYSDQEIDLETSLTADFILQQNISDPEIDKLKNNAIFDFEFWAKSNSPDPIELSFSIKGLNLESEQFSKEIQGDWKKYQGVFVIPKNSVQDDSRVWLQIELHGSGTIFLDNIRIKVADHFEQELFVDLSDNLANVPIMRLELVPLGDQAYPSESWLSSEKSYSFYYQDEGNLKIISQPNLVSCLEACRKYNTNPWLIINSQVSDLELRHFMQYLFGQQNTPLGELRDQHGALGRYSETFNQFYLEINDQNKLFVNDWQRKSYVNRVIQILSETPEYAQIKNRLVFIDGMEYKENIISSDADYHASDFSLQDNISNIDQLNQHIENFSEMIPRNPGRMSTSGFDLVRRTDLLNSEIRSADLISLSLSMLGDEVEAALLNFDLTSDIPENSFAECYAQIGRSISGMSPYVLTSNYEQENIIAFAYGSDNKRTIIIANLSDDSASCQILNIDLKGFQQSFYDANGELLEQSVMKLSKTVFSILPGGVVVLEGNVK